jgi:hypothetical protein
MPTTHGIGIDIQVDKKEVDLLLGAIESTLLGQNLFQYLRDYMMPYMRQRTAQRFASEGDDASGKWAPLMEVTNDIREALGFPREHPINRRSGALENFLERGNIEFQMQADSAAMFYPGRPASSLLTEKLMTAQGGSRRAVARPVVALSQADMSYFVSNFSFWFAREVQSKFNMGQGYTSGGLTP